MTEDEQLQDRLNRLDKTNVFLSNKVDHLEENNQILRVAGYAKDDRIREITAEKNRFSLMMVAKLVGVKMLFEMVRSETTHRRKNAFFDSACIVLEAEIGQLTRNIDFSRNEMPF